MRSTPKPRSVATSPNPSPSAGKCLSPGFWCRPGPHRVIAILVILAVVSSAVGRVGVAAQDGKVITLGESLSEEQRDELLDYFGYDGGDEVITITVEQTRDAMRGIFAGADAIPSAFSSTALTCRELGEGIDVTTYNITFQPAVPPSMYALALVTAGIGDVTLVVAAPDLAVAQGMTALAGVFESYERKPCDSGLTSETRQRLALEAMAIAADFGNLLYYNGNPNGMQVATDLVLQSQQQMVVNRLSGEAEIGDVVAAQEQAANVQMPADLRDKLVALLVRLARENIDWSTFAEGWTIEFNNADAQTFQVEMTGTGIAIERARQTATTEAAAAMTATADAAAAMTATAGAENAAAQTATAAAEAAAMTATADAQATVDAQATMDAQATVDAQATSDAQTAMDAQATQDAVAAMTATAAAVPTATPPPIGLAGKVVSAEEAAVVVLADGGEGQPAAYQVDPEAVITRDGVAVPLADIEENDTVELTLHGGTQRVLTLAATAAPTPSSLGDVLKFLPILGVVVLAPAGFWAWGKRPTDPFVVKRVAS